MTTFDISELPLFRGCSRRQVRQAQKLMTGIRVQAGRVLMEQGERGRECLIVCDGTVSIEHDGEIIAEVGRGEVVGEAALLSDRCVRTATAIAATDCEVLVLSAREFAERVPTVWVRINRIAVTHLARTLDHEGIAS